MTKEIIKKCNFYDKQVGCYHTFDGKCNKENCQTYNLIKENEELKKQVENFKKMFEEQFEYKEINLKKLEEIREICTTYAKTEDYIISETFSEFLEIVFNKADEVLK